MTREINFFDYFLLLFSDIVLCCCSLLLLFQKCANYMPVSQAVKSKS